MTFTVDVLLSRILQCDAGPGYDQSCLRVQQVDSYHSCHICPPTFSFGDAVALLRESYRLVQRNSNVSCSYLIELYMFLELDVQVYFSFDLSSTTGFKFNSLRVSLLTVLRVVYAIVRLGYARKIIFFPRLCSLLAPFRLPSMDFLQVSWFLRVSKLIDCPNCGFFCHKDYFSWALVKNVQI